jgi:hypothetical protein
VLVELASGVDALYLSGRAAVPDALIERLESLRSEAVSAGRPVAVDLDGNEFMVAGHGFGKYRYCLRHPYGQVGVTASRSLPPIRVQPRSEFLHGVGPLPAVNWFEEALWSAAGPVLFTVSRMDLHSDWQGWSVDGDQRGRFVCRADRRDLHEENERLTGFEFGRRSTGTVCARIYDKSVEQERKGTDFWLDVWGDRRDPTRPVLRVEFEFGRQALREYGLDRPAEAVEAAGALWTSATEEWLTYRSPTADTTRSRWPVAPEWRDIQRASFAGGARGLTRMYDGRKAGSLRTLMPSLNGFVVKLAALTGADSIENACSRLPGFLRDYELVSRQSFASRVEARRGEMGVL